MSRPGVIALVSMPGGGKSTIGHDLARRLKREFLDTDTVIEHRIGCSLPQFFKREGEARFRDVEEEVLAELVGRSDIVLATGGGTILREANRRLLARHAVVAYLRSHPEELFRRLRHDTKRPLLQVADPLDRLKEMYAVRDPLYAEIASFSVDTGRASRAAVVNMIIMELERTGAVDAKPVSKLPLLGEIPDR